jgi:hypothetical protein
MRLAPHLLRLWVMPRTQSPSQPSDPEDYKPERGDERSSSARKLRPDDEAEAEAEDDDAFDDDDETDDDDFDYEEARMVEQASAAKERDGEPARRDDEDDEEALTDADVMEVLDLDDLNKMEGPDT